MSKSLKTSTTGNLPANASELLGALENVNTSLKAAGGLDFLRLLSDGMFVYGADNTEVEEGSIWAANPYTIQHGFACWEDKPKGQGANQLLDEVMVAMNVPKPIVSELPDLGYPWAAQVSVQLQCLSGEDEGEVVLYKGTSLGLSNVIKELSGAIIGQLKSGEDELIVPCVTLESDHYDHKQYGRTYFPVLAIQHWTDMDGATASGEEDGEDPEPEAPENEIEDESPKKKPPVKAVAGDEPAKKTAKAKKEPAPATRRRRRAAS